MRRCLVGGHDSDISPMRDSKRYSTHAGSRRPCGRGSGVPRTHTAGRLRRHMLIIVCHWQRLGADSPRRTAPAARIRFDTPEGGGDNARVAIASLGEPRVTVSAPVALGGGRRARSASAYAGVALLPAVPGKDLLTYRVPDALRGAASTRHARGRAARRVAARPASSWRSSAPHRRISRTSVSIEHALDDEPIVGAGGLRALPMDSGATT